MVYRPIVPVLNFNQTFCFTCYCTEVSYTLCLKKVVHQTLGDNCVNTYWIFKILSLLLGEVYFQQNPHNTSHHTFSVLLHSLAKVTSSSIDIAGRKCKRKCNMHWFLNTPKFAFAYASLHILCKYQAILSNQVLWTEAAFSACLA